MSSLKVWLTVWDRGLDLILIQFRDASEQGNYNEVFLGK